MIVDRQEYAVKPGHTEEALAMMKEASKGIGRPFRIYVDLAGPTFTVAYEVEYESMAEKERVNAERWAAPEAAAFFKKWCELIQGPGCREIWELVK